MKYPESKDGAVILGLTEMAAGEEVLVRMGLSFISNEQACSNAEQEIPTFDFEAVSQSANSQFEDLLNRIRVNTTDVPEDTLTLFYSSVRHMCIIANVVIPNIDLTAELHQRESTMEHRRTNLRLLLLYLGYLPLLTSIIQYPRPRRTIPND